MQIIKGKQYFDVRPFQTLRDMLDQATDLYQDQVAFRFRTQLDRDPESKSYRAFRQDINALGTALFALGMQGSHMAVIGENSYPWCLAYTTTVCGAGLAVPLDRLLMPDELISLMDRGRVAVVFYDPSFEDLLMQASERLPSLTLLVRMRAGKPKAEQPDWSKPLAGLKDTGPTWMRLEDLLEAGDARLKDQDTGFTQVVIDPQAPMALLFTSGTTASSKAVLLSHRNVCANIQGLAGVIRLKPGTRLLSVLPLHHTFENTCGLFMALYIGGEIVQSDGLRYIQKNLQEYGIDMIIGVPALFANFYNKVQSTLVKTGKDRLVRLLIPLTQGLRWIGIDLRRLVYRQLLDAFGGRLRLGICGAAPIDPKIIRFFDAIGIRILEGYGLTETSPVVTGCNSKFFVPGTVGQPIFGVELAIDAPQAGEDGEILVRGDSVMLGYYQDEEETSRVLTADGWFRTGDLGRIDPRKKSLSITGRVKSMIVLKSGKKVFPEEIEQLFDDHDWIKESLVWGEPSVGGEVVVSAKLVIDSDRFSQLTGRLPDGIEIRKALEKTIREINAKLPSFKKVRQFVFSFKDLVKTTTLKVRRPIEIERIQKILNMNRFNWKDLSGQNIDTFDVAVNLPEGTADL